jgi:hypothetical protein
MILPRCIGVSAALEAYFPHSIDFNTHASDAGLCHFISIMRPLGRLLSYALGYSRCYFHMHLPHHYRYTLAADGTWQQQVISKHKQIKAIN